MVPCPAPSLYPSQTSLPPMPPRDSRPPLKSIVWAGRLRDRRFQNGGAESELSSLLFAPTPSITVGLAVQRDTFGRIRIANGTPRLAAVPPDQDAEEFELHFSEGVSLDILTTARTRRFGSHREIPRQAGRRHPASGISLRERRPRHANPEREIWRFLPFYSRHPPWLRWHASQFFPRCFSRRRKGAHRTVRIAVPRIGVRIRRSQILLTGSSFFPVRYSLPRPQDFANGPRLSDAAAWRERGITIKNFT